MFRHCKSLLGMLGASLLLAIPAAAASSAIPGTLNYVEGQVAVAGQTVTRVRWDRCRLGRTKCWKLGKAGPNCCSPLEFFCAWVTTARSAWYRPAWPTRAWKCCAVRPSWKSLNSLRTTISWILMNGASTRLDKQGLYAFQCRYAPGSGLRWHRPRCQQDDQHKDLGKGQELALNGAWKVAHFDTKSQAAQDPLYAWSNLRSEYEAEASMQSARNVFVGGGPYWDGPGWYWNPYWDMYGFVPGDGIWYSPFGWPFYSP